MYRWAVPSAIAGTTPKTNQPTPRELRRPAQQARLVGTGAHPKRRRPQQAAAELVAAGAADLDPAVGRAGKCSGAAQPAAHFQKPAAARAGPLQGRRRRGRRGRCTKTRLERPRHAPAVAVAQGQGRRGPRAPACKARPTPQWARSAWRSARRAQCPSAMRTTVATQAAWEAREASPGQSAAAAGTAWPSARVLPAQLPRGWRCRCCSTQLCPAQPR